GDVTISESKSETQRVGDADAHERIERVEGEIARILRNVRLRMGGAEPGAADGIDAENRGADKQKNSDVDEKGPTPARARGPLHCRRKRRSLGGREREFWHRKVRPQ